MTNPNVPRPEINAHHVDEAVSIAAGQLMLASCTDVLAPKIISPGPPSYVVAYPNAEAPRYAVRITHGAQEDAEDLISDTELEVDTIRALRENGAQVLNYVRGVTLVDTPEIPGVFAATASVFLPGKPTYRGYGRAIASLHNASTKIDISRIPEVQPLAAVEKYIPYLLDRQAAGNPFKLGNTVLAEQDLETLIRHLARGTEMLDELFAVTSDAGHPLVILQEDVHSEQVAQDKHGVDTLMDVHAVKGPAAIDYAGRAHTDWGPRFNVPLRDIIDYDEGYLDLIRPEIAPTLEMQKLAKEYMNIRSSLILFWLTVEAEANGHPGEEWMLQESLHRMRSIDQRDVRWNGLDKARKEAMRNGRPAE